MSKFTKLTPIALLVLSSLSAQAAELDTLVVTSSRLTDSDALAANITILDATAIANSAANSLPALLAQQAGINTTSFSGHSNTASVGIRTSGSTATQNTLILLDGRRLNDIDLSSVNFSAIPIENIERIEIVRGSGSVLYGDGATGGIINIITKNPRDAKSHTTLKATTGAFNHKELNGSATYASDSFGVTANINSLRNDGYRDNNKLDIETGQIDLRIPTSSGEVYMQLGGYRQEQQLPGERQVDLANNINQLVTDRKGTNTPNNWANEDSEYATIGYSHAFNATDSFIIDASIRQKQQTSQFFGNFSNNFTDTDLDTWSLTPRFNFSRELFSLPVDWTLGSDLYVYDYKSNRADLKQNKNTPIHKLDVEQKSLAVYGQAIIEVQADTAMTLAWRTQRVQQKAQDTLNASAPGASIFDSEAPDFNQTDYENSYELGLKHFLNDSWDVYGRLGRSVRFGTVDELFEFNNSFAQVFSPLAPQTSHDAEIGLAFHNKWLDSSISYFEQDIKNEIRFDASTFQNINLDKTKHKGIEFSASAMISAVKLSANYTYLNAKFTDGTNDGNRLTLIPEHTYNLNAETQLANDLLLAANLNFVSQALMSNDNSNTFDQRIPSYKTVNLKLKKTFSNLELAVQVNNLFNEKYFNYAINSTSTAGRYNAYSLPVRNAYVSLSYTFD